MSEIIPKPDYLLIRAPSQLYEAERTAEEECFTGFLCDYPDFSTSVTDLFGTYVSKRSKAVFKVLPDNPDNELLGNIWKKLLELEADIDSIKSEITKKPRESGTNQRVILFFKRMEQFNDRVLPYLNKHDVDNEIRQGGVVIVDQSLVKIFKEMDLDFDVVRSLKELHANYKEELADYANQVRKYYGLAERSR